MNKKKVKLENIKNEIELSCPLCGTTNKYKTNGEYKFLYCNNCKYVYAWESDDIYLVIEENNNESKETQ